MKNTSKIEILEAVLNSQDLGGKDRMYLSLCLKENANPSEKIDPLTRYIFNAIVQEDTGSGIEITLDYAITQLKRAKAALSEQRITLFDMDVIE